MDELLLHNAGIAVSIQGIEEADLGLDCRIGEVAAAGGEIAIREVLIAVARLHRIDKGSLLVVAKIGQGCGVESGHHFIVFMNEVVAVELRKR